MASNFELPHLPGLLGEMATLVAAALPPHNHAAVPGAVVSAFRAIVGAAYHVEFRGRYYPVGDLLAGFPTGTATAEGIDAIVRLIRDPSASGGLPSAYETVEKMRNLIVQTVELSAHNRPALVSQEGNRLLEHSPEAHALAAIASIARNSNYPVIERPDNDWAWLFLQRFPPRAFDSSLSVGRKTLKEADPHARKREVMRIVEGFGTQSYEAVERYGVPRALHASYIVPYRYIQRRLVSVAVFRRAKVNATSAIRNAVASLVEEGWLICVDETELQDLGYQGMAYRHESWEQYKYDDR